jgi:hypothetical protein
VVGNRKVHYLHPADWRQGGRSGSGIRLRVSCVASVEKMTRVWHLDIFVTLEREKEGVTSD